MELKVNVSLVEKWIEGHRPYGHERLSVEAQMSFGTIALIRRGVVPGRKSRERLASAIGVAEEELFAPVGAGAEVAS